MKFLVVTPPSIFQIIRRGPILPYVYKIEKRKTFKGIMVAGGDKNAATLIRKMPHPQPQLSSQ